jgi:sterol desaturase/sphingolipid hydroxylase (fatty acid hydroxylase superfamily)
MATLEVLLPFRKRLQTRLYRWPSNLGIAAFNSLLVQLAIPISAVSLGASLDGKEIGLLNLIQIHPILSLIFGIIILDLTIYSQHVFFHKVPLLWRLHRMHHTDVDFDVSLGARFHPLEILISVGIKFGVILAFGISAESVFIFEILLNATAMFNHSNISLPGWADRPLRWLLVTPDMHRIHHSVIRTETDSNYGFNLPWWDRLFRTYSCSAKNDPQTMDIGLKEFRDQKDNRIDQMLIQPFR